MSEQNKLSTREKCLKVNLEPHVYGTFAEIGAGQEVVRYFFQAGAASGTIASTISAYDMAFSDKTYGEASRYVSKDRLNQMLDIEYAKLKEILADKKDKNTQLFAYANTVSARNYFGTNLPHGWMGVKFRSQDSEEENSFVIHVRMLDDNNLSQQQAVGVVGVNMIHATFFHQNNIDEFISSLLDNLSVQRIEIDMIEVSGPHFKDWDNRILALKLVSNAMTPAVLFGADGSVLSPYDTLYKKDLLVLRGSFRPPTYVNTDMLRAGQEAFEDEGVDPKKFATVCNITLSNLKGTWESEDHGGKDFLARIDLLGSLGQMTLVTSFTEYYRLNEYFSRYKGDRIRFVTGIYNLITLFEEDSHKNLQGSLLEAFGRTFARDSKLYVYPMKDHNTGKIQDCENFEYPEAQKHLFKYLLKNEKIVALKNYNEEYFHIWSRVVLKMIQKGEKGWEEMLPSCVAEIVKDKCLFGYPCEPENPNYKKSK